MEGRIFGKPMITQEEMRKRIQELGLRIAQDYQEKDLLMIGVLKGAFVFFSDLARAVPLPLHVDFLVVSSYGEKKKSSGAVKVISDTTQNLKGKDVLVVEDIVDSGLTLTFLKKKLMARKPNSLRFCTLLDKPQRRKTEVTIDYVGFTIPNKYVVGYGLDYENKYRNLPYIAVLENVREDA
ncbi:hypoxanthine phosphoribosyltransferase [Candidatus Manganitrophus noduliformans]|uniref:Hypoxanthine phosphoribosyltransferase n=1 Tax=Candidatus Manganitrophus noduliformans TaxID=2606439 RepID=A0A7X6DP58_9BACT|nr:hypoxanthine phosphoribosyltransferase [Candidatus Manganitrophus noduliformans]NKE70684.1 hypoxanthine phosphoribosyltransferase [Candidatus Manganitrophus noduliformans]